jgi:hypothetical protein
VSKSQGEALDTRLARRQKTLQLHKQSPRRENKHVGLVHFGM